MQKFLVVFISPVMARFTKIMLITSFLVYVFDDIMCMLISFYFCELIVTACAVGRMTLLVHYHPHFCAKEESF